MSPAAVTLFSASHRTIRPRAILQSVPFSITRPSIHSPKVQVRNRTRGGRCGFTARLYSADARLTRRSVSPASARAGLSPQKP